MQSLKVKKNNRVKVQNSDRKLWKKSKQVYWDWNWSGSSEENQLKFEKKERKPLKHQQNFGKGNKVT